MEKILKPSLIICYLIGSPWVLYRSYLKGDLGDKAFLMAVIGPGALWLVALMIMFFGWMMWDLATGVTGQDSNPSLGRFIISLIIAMALAVFFSGDTRCIIDVRSVHC